MNPPLRALAEALAGEVGDGLLGVDDGFGPPTADVTAAAWLPALQALAAAGATYFDFLTAVDELDEGFSVVAHVSRPDASEHLLLRTRIPREPAVLASATGVFAGAAWHERETAEMFGIDFSGYADVSGLGLRPLLLPDGFTARPLRKEFVLAARVAKDWPGAKDPADPPGGGPARRKMAPPGVPADWAHEPVPAAGDPGTGDDTPLGGDHAAATEERAGAASHPHGDHAAATEERAGAASHPRGDHAAATEERAGAAPHPHGDHAAATEEQLHDHREHGGTDT